MVACRIRDVTREVATGSKPVFAYEDELRAGECAACDRRMQGTDDAG